MFDNLDILDDVSLWAIKHKARWRWAGSFQEQCVGCHGPDGRAKTEIGEKMGAADLTSVAVQQQSDSSLLKTVKDGKAKMPSFDSKLSSDEIHAVIAYIRELAKKQ